MHFIVTRTSLRGRGEDRPCSSATQVEMMFHDRRGAARPEDIPCYRANGTNEWYTIGKNHRVEDGRIVRDMVHQMWIVSIPDLEALLGFAVENGELCITVGDQHDLPMIEIVDDYRE